MARSGPPERLALADLAGTRRSFARIVRSFYRNEIPEAKARALGYCFSVLCALFRAEIEADVEKRLDALEAAIAAKEKGNQ
jgi:hypothetical protein